MHKRDASDAFDGNRLGSPFDFHFHLGAHRLHEAAKPIAVSQQEDIRFGSLKIARLRLELDQCRLIQWNRDHPKPSVFPPRGTAALVCYKPAEGPDQDLAVSHMHEREWAPLLRGSITLGNPAERARKQIRPICSSHCTRCLQESCSPRTICDEHLYLGDCFGRSRLRLLRLRDEQE